MLQNNLDPAVAEDPANLIIYGGSGKAARNWESLEAILKTLQGLGNDETPLGPRGIPQGTYETLAELARQHFGGSLKGRWVLTGGMGGMSGAQPLAVTMNEGACLDGGGDPGKI